MKFYKFNPYSEIHGSFTKGQERKNNYQLEIIYCPYKAAEFCIKSLVTPLEVCSPFHLRKVFYILV